MSQVTSIELSLLLTILYITFHPAPSEVLRQLVSDLFFTISDEIKSLCQNVTQLRCATNINQPFGSADIGGEGG